MARKHSSTESARRDRAEKAAPETRSDEPGLKALERLRELGALDGRSPRETLANLETERTRAASPFKPWFPAEDQD